MALIWSAILAERFGEAVDKIKNGTIADYIYDPHTASLRRAGRDQTLA